jgi:menaquinone-dependent protoporphyrinogen IX oxidase
MARVAILFENSDGQVTRVAHRIAEVLRGRGHSVEISDLRSLMTTFSLRSFQGAILGCRVRASGYPVRLREFATENIDLLERMQAWLYCMRPDGGGGNPAGATRQLQRLEDETGWWPQRVLWLGEERSYRDESVLARLQMRIASALRGRLHDAAKDYAPTDWRAVRRFAIDFCGPLPSPSRELSIPASEAVTEIRRVAQE